jgi:hypothetical protein
VANFQASKWLGRWADGRGYPEGREDLHLHTETDLKMQMGKDG